MTYAERTTVSPEKSKGEIERILARYGATGFAYGWEPGRARLMFRAKERMVAFELPLPHDPKEFYRDAAGRMRSPSARTAAMEQETRRRWRALALAIKAKLEVVQSGISSFEEEFLAHILLPDGSRVGDWARPQLAHVYETGTMPALLPGAAPARQRIVAAEIVEGTP